MNNGERLHELSLKAGSELLEKLGEWTPDKIRSAIAHFDKGSNFDKGVAQFLRLYLGARTLGTISKRDPG